MNTKELRSGQIITFTLSFTDAEGDVVADSFYVEKFEPKCVASRFKSYYSIPNFPTSKNQSGEITVTYGYNNNTVPQQIKSPQCNRNDTAVFKFVLRDKEKNKSDTAASDPIVIFR